MPDQNKEDRLVDQSDGFFGDPPLLRGEDKTNSLKLLTAVAQHYQPEDVIDWMMVNDVTNKYLEETRFRRMSSALIEGAKPEALEILLRPFYSSGTMFNAGPSEIAKDYFCGDPKTKKAMAVLVAHCGITVEIIEAKATHLVIGPLLVLDRMSGNREKSRRNLRKEHELRRKETEPPLAASHNPADRASHVPKKAAA